MSKLIPLLLIVSTLALALPSDFGVRVKTASLSDIKGPAAILGTTALALGGVTITTALVRAVVRPKTEKAERDWNIVMAVMAGVGLTCMFTSYAFPAR